MHRHMFNGFEIQRLESFPANENPYIHDYVRQGTSLDEDVEIMWGLKSKEGLVIVHKPTGKRLFIKCPAYEVRGPIEIYHRKSPNFRLYTPADVQDHLAAWGDNGYKKVATIADYPEGCDKSELDFAYYYTNNIDHLWTENKCVTPIGTSHRSTSVGDVIKTRDGKFFFVAPSGFQPLPT